LRKKTSYNKKLFNYRKYFHQKRVKSWHEAFLLLYEELKLNPAHVVFDEFQWMANYRNEIVSELKPICDLHISGMDGITLILCGSIASFMINTDVPNVLT
jgi:hypothetical protein